MGSKFIEQQGLKDNRILQLLEGENIKEKIFNYEQNFGVINSNFNKFKKREQQCFLFL